MSDLQPFPAKEVAELNLDAHFFGWSRQQTSLVASASPMDDLKGHRGILITGDVRRKRLWETALAKPNTLTHVYAKTRVNQSLFDRLCELKSLQRLSMDSTSITDCSGLANLPKLTHLAIGSSPKLESIDPLSRLAQLQSLDLSGNLQHIHRLDALSELKNLRGLGLRGMESRLQIYDSLGPIAKLVRLRYLLITGVRIKRCGLAPLASLAQLRYLNLNTNELRFWPKEDFGHLQKHLVHLKTNLLELAATDQQFRMEHGIA